MQGTAFENELVPMYVSFCDWGGACSVWMSRTFAESSQCLAYCMISLGVQGPKVPQGFRAPESKDQGRGRLNIQESPQSVHIVIHING